ncbi:MAG: SDR family NAD(P)-dependent oxidoreductase [Actinobacteria bacterium]|uniref:Unannotated protein n=1 Tax=freshwater metagenome TaxID=449393 RepID=A0A6J7QMJ5_9ZZZZ|nr:SDR family NAD(P)-dependent oxidoreductase [Actinomycetota bacterium]MSX10284.1 SDR family NAD(P)-dependent oxidoreductase [Actinomycetota bacterium]MSX67490.1 SDR family NAD(P)-dependent oxidoreductase [Actinomycetota bacterium]
MSFDVAGTCAVITGGGHGIGRAFAEAIAKEGANVVIADVNKARADKIANRLGGISVACDVGDHASLVSLVEQAVDTFGPVKVFCSNAGILDQGPDLGSSIEQIDAITRVNLLSHVWAAQAVLPSMIEQGGGYFVQTLSSAALITGPAGMGYTFTKHGALGFAEWLALNYADKNIHVSCLCPNLVNTGLLGRDEDNESAESPFVLPEGLGDVVEPEACAEATIAAMKEGRFLVLPHQRVGESFKRKANDYDAWLATSGERIRGLRPSP